MVIEHHPQGGQQCCVILQWLAHAHHDDIGDHPLGLLQVPAQKMLGKPQLPQDFSGAQVPAEALVPGRTKAAAHGTTGLG